MLNSNVRERESSMFIKLWVKRILSMRGHKLLLIIFPGGSVTRAVWVSSQLALFRRTIDDLIESAIRDERRSLMNVVFDPEYFNSWARSCRNKLRTWQDCQSFQNQQIHRSELWKICVSPLRMCLFWYIFRLYANGLCSRAQSSDTWEPRHVLWLIQMI